MYQFSYQCHFLLLVNVHVANLVVITMREDKKKFILSTLLMSMAICFGKMSLELLSLLLPLF